MKRRQLVRVFPVVLPALRNKEGHVVTQAHQFDPASYRAIEAALVELYASVFHEHLTVRFSFERRERGAWRVAP